MDYKQKYKKALKVASQWHKDGIGDIKNVVECIFPELKESEDEQHRKWILEYLYDGLRKSDEQFKDQYKSAIAWLEKQAKKQTNSYCQENCKGFQETGKCFADGECDAKRKAEQKSAWSEEDEEWLIFFEKLLEFAYNKDPHGLGTMCVGGKVWLKSLKPHWKPTKEQINSFRIALQSMPYSKDKEVALTLLEDLQKL